MFNLLDYNGLSLDELPKEFKKDIMNKPLNQTWRLSKRFLHSKNCHRRHSLFTKRWIVRIDKNCIMHIKKE